MDGKIENSEYQKPNKITFENALSITDFSAQIPLATSELKKYAGAQNVFLSCDLQSFYIAFEMTAPLSEAICAVNHPQYGKCFSVSVDLALSVAANNPFLCYGTLRNTYFFSADTLACIGFFGTRDLVRDGERELLARVSTSSSLNPFCDSDGNVWDGAHYLDQVCLKQALGEKPKLVFEARIPIGEVLLTLPEAERSVQLAALGARQESVCGLFDIKTSLCDNAHFSDGTLDTAYLSFSLVGKEVSPLSSDGRTWSEIYSDLVDFDVVSSQMPLARPFSFSSIEKKNVTKTDAPSENSPSNDPGDLSSSQSDSEGTSSPSPAPSDGDDSDHSILSFPENEEAVETSDLFSDLPENADDLPEDTQILYLDTTKTNGKSESDPLASGVLVISGVLLIIATVIVAMIFRFIEKKENNTKNI